MRRVVVWGTGLLLGVISPAWSQSYHYNYGDARVTNQSQTGLSNPSGTYIGSGTLSQSAQGKNAGTGNALPSTTMGGYIRTPGDAIYNGQGDAGCIRLPNGSVVYKDDYQRMIMQRMPRQRRLLPQANNYYQQQGNFYVPGSNGGAASYGTSGGGTGAYYQNGMASYGSNYRSR